MRGGARKPASEYMRAKQYQVKAWAKTNGRYKIDELAAAIGCSPSSCRTATNNLVRDQEIIGYYEGQEKFYELADARRETVNPPTVEELIQRKKWDGSWALLPR